MSRFCVVFVACILIFPVVVNSANILLLLGLPSPSHHIWNTRIVNELAARGHNLTVLSVDQSKTPPKNVHYLHLEKVYETIHDSSKFDMNEFVAGNAFAEVILMYKLSCLICPAAFESQGSKTLQNYPINFKFDLVIFDCTAMPCLLGFLHKFNYPPLIAMSAYKYSPMVPNMMGGHYFPAYIPMPNFPFTTSMTLTQRIQNTALIAIDYLYMKYIFVDKMNKFMMPYFGKDLPDLRDLEHRTTVFLLNTHPAVDHPVPLPPNVIEVGGLQIRDTSPLPNELENFIEKSKTGAVLISFGTNVNSIVFSEEQQQIVIDAVKKFPTYNFIWKFEKDLSNGKVPNLLVTQWLPQNDLLAHPKIKAFVTHSGGLSTHEAIWHGVPMVTMPFLLDQNGNSKAAVEAGIALKVDVSTITVKKLADAIRSILEDPSYAERIKIKSQRFKDRPMKPLDTAIWWIEYVLRDPNPTHLRSPTIDLGIWRSNCYDIIFYSIALLILIVCIIRKALQKCCKLLTSDNRKKVKLS